MSEATLTPEVLWAQRSSTVDPAKNFVYLTIVVPDVPKDKFQLEIKPTGLTFTGYSNTLKRTYHLALEFYGVVDEVASKVNHTNRDIELKLIKKELKEEYWPRLLKEAKKVHFLKTDFDKWVDEDEQNEAQDEDFSNFGGMGGMGGMGGDMGGLGGMGGMGGMPGMGGDFGGIDFSKLGGGGDLPEGDEEEEEDDDEMPALEGEEVEEVKTDAKADATTDAKAAKITEV